MKLRKLYGLLLASVLAVGGCEPGSEDTPQRSAERRPPAAEQAQDARDTVVLFLGDSITAGYGLAREAAYPGLIQQKIDSLGWPIRVVNGGLSGDTSSGGLRRLDWLMRDRVDVLVVALGGNDGLRGIEPGAMRENLEQIIDEARERNEEIQIVLAGMRMPPNLGASYTQRFERVYRELAEQKAVHFIPFLLEGVGGEARLNQRDGIHPTAEGQRLIAEHVWQLLHPILETMRQRDAPA